jgi:transmembrane protein EpsG
MNGIRQFMAAGIVFTATKYILNGNFKKYVITILFAATIHKTALVLLPIYFIVRREAWTRVTMLLIASSILIVLGFNQFIGLLFSALENTKYGEYSNFAEGGANILRVIVNAAPVFIAFLGRHKLRELWPKSDYIVNLSIISVVFGIISTQNWIFARFNIYFGLYNLILISWIVLLFKANSQRFIYYAILIFYLIYFYYEHVISFGFNYISDYISI